MTTAATLPADADPALRVDRLMTAVEMWQRPATTVIYDDDLQYPTIPTLDNIAYFLVGQPLIRHPFRHMHLVV